MNRSIKNALRDFHAGTNFYAYKLLGAHRDGEKIIFRVWAPHAEEVFLVGDFNSWDESSPMEKISSGGVYQCSVDAERLISSPLYKFKIKNDGESFYKADPYGRYMQKPPETASSYYESEGFEWSDENYIVGRHSAIAEGMYKKPVNIYEVHLGSYKRRSDGSFASYRELAPDLASYLKRMSYTHIELMPIAEHPNDASWGYQVCGYYAPTSRFGDPDDFRFFVNTMHRAGIGVILDWVPAHFPKDEHGLFEFDGAPLYECSDPMRNENKVWGTRYFDTSKPEVRSFLVSNAVYLAKEFHIDGIRVDAVSSMLYLDYDKEEGEWTPNEQGTNIDLESLSFLKMLNRKMKELCPDTLMIAEESGYYPKLTSSDEDGVGFDMKWNMGWMNDSLTYARTEPEKRADEHFRLTFPLMYAFSEKYVLPISHDEVVYGKKSLLDKMPGEYEMKFAGMRAYLTYMMTQSGKKLSFMSNEFGQFSEWNFNSSVQWFLLDYDMHKKMLDFSADLNALYLSRSELWECDGGWDGYEWVQCDSSEDSVIAYKRKNAIGQELLCVISFRPKNRLKYRLKVEAGRYRCILSSDSKKYGGSGVYFPKEITSEADQYGNHRITLDLPPYAAYVFEIVN